MHRILDELIGMIYPPRCPGCDGLLLPGELVCESCADHFLTVSEPTCRRCGKPLDDERQEYCADCGPGSFAKRHPGAGHPDTGCLGAGHFGMGHPDAGNLGAGSAASPHAYKQGKAVFVYRGGVVRSLYRFKYGGRREYAAFYASEAARLYGGWVRRHGMEAIVPVPLYAAKKRRRGYNQAEAFARALGRELSLPVEAGMVRRVRETTPQKELNDRQRRENLKGAFRFSPGGSRYSRILVVDDIYTTGSTVDAVAKALLSGGVEDVYFICISIGTGF